MPAATNFRRSGWRVATGIAGIGVVLAIGARPLPSPRVAPVTPTLPTRTAATPPGAPPCDFGRSDRDYNRVVECFTRAEFHDVVLAYKAFRRHPDRAIPVLVTLLEREDRAPLVNTADLIYPGATVFFGHGWAVPYDIDWIAVRAGWVLEELAFQRFGFQSGKLRAPPKAAMAKASSWFREGKHVRWWDALLAAIQSDDSDRRRAALEYLVTVQGWG